MANNDRVTRDPSPSWIPDNQTPNKYLATKRTNGDIGWNNEDVTRNLLSRDASNKPGWRDKKVVPAGMALVEFDSSIFYVTSATSGTPITSGNFVELGSHINVYLVEQTYEYGVRTVIVNGRLSNNYFMKNFGSVSGRASPNLIEDILVVGNIQITGTGRKRSHTGIAGPAQLIEATLNVNSWGDKGSQTTSFTINNSYQEDSTFEFYVGDEVEYVFEVNSAYHWANFRYGYDINDMYPVNKSLVVYPQNLNGGKYVQVAGERRLYLDMSAVKPVQFYLYQEGSSRFTNTKVKVDQLNSNLSIYKNITLPQVGTEVNYGKNGVGGNHVPLYQGMVLRVYCTNNSKIAPGYAISYDSLTPMPETPTDFSYIEEIYVTIGNNANITGEMCVGLRYVNLRYKGSILSLSSSYTYSQDTDTFKNFRDNLYYMGQSGSVTPYFTSKVHRLSTSNPIYSETDAIRLGFSNSDPILEWEYDQTGVFQKGSLNALDRGVIYPDGTGTVGVSQDENGNPIFTVLTTEISIGPIITQFFGEIKVVFSNNDSICQIYGRGDGINLDINAPVEDWYVPGSTTQYIPYSTLINIWGDDPWRGENLWNITPYFIAVTRSA